jgi:putative SOS response-associated peptidase YedK
MCGRYKLVQPVPEVAAELGAEPGEAADFTPHLDASPTQPLPVLTQQQPGRLQLFRWGLVPSWAKDARQAASLINARAETLAERPAFKEAVHQRRCVVPVSAFYEWRNLGGKQKQKCTIGLRQRPWFSLAGLWAEWQPPQGAKLYTFTIITTQPNALMAPIHHRMPVIIAPGHEAAWLDLANDAREFCQPYPAHRMEVSAEAVAYTPSLF